MMSHVVHAIVAFASAHSGLAYALAFLLAGAESLPVIGALVPGTAAIVAFGALVPTGAIGFWPLLLATTAGAIVGDGLPVLAGASLQGARRLGLAAAASPRPDRGGRGVLRPSRWQGDRDRPVHPRRAGRGAAGRRHRGDVGGAVLFDERALGAAVGAGPCRDGRAHRQVADRAWRGCGPARRPGVRGVPAAGVPGVADAPRRRLARPARRAARRPAPCLGGRAEHLATKGGARPARSRPHRRLGAGRVGGGLDRQPVAAVRSDAGSARRRSAGAGRPGGAAHVPGLAGRMGRPHGGGGTRNRGRRGDARSRGRGGGLARGAAGLAAGAVTSPLRSRARSPSPWHSASRCGIRQGSRQGRVSARCPALPWRWRSPSTSFSPCWWPRSGAAVSASARSPGRSCWPA